MPSVPLISARPSFARRVSGSISASARASAAGRRAPSSSTSPSPIRTRAQCARGARSPLAPSEPCSGTTGVMPAFNSRNMASATSGLAPEYPIARDRARSSTIARTTSRSTGSPNPAACERIRARCSCSRCSAGIGVVASEPNPVETPYAGSGAAASCSTILALSAIASRASSESSTPASLRATATTSAGASPVPASLITRVGRWSRTRPDYPTNRLQTTNAPTRIRTWGLLLRRESLYPAELSGPRAQDSPTPPR